MTFSHGTIAQRAQKIWDQAGRPSGRDTEFWLEAESQLRFEHAAAAKVAAPTRPEAPAEAVAPARRATKRPARRKV